MIWYYVSCSFNHHFIAFPLFMSFKSVTSQMLLNLFLVPEQHSWGQNWWWWWCRSDSEIIVERHTHIVEGILSCGVTLSTKQFSVSTNTLKFIWRCPVHVSWDIYNLELGFSWFSILFQCKCWYRTLNLGLTTSVLIHPNSFFITIPSFTLHSMNYWWVCYINSTQHPPRGFCTNIMNFTVICKHVKDTVICLKICLLWSSSLPFLLSFFLTASYILHLLSVECPHWRLSVVAISTGEEGCSAWFPFCSFQVLHR